MQVTIHTLIFVNSVDLLHVACEHDHPSVVEYLLTKLQINPNIKNYHQQSPLSLAKSKEVIKLLIQHGAKAENVYTQHRRILGNVFSTDPLMSPVKMFVIGHGGEGKSTLIEAMKHEPTMWAPLLNLFIRPKKVDEVSQRTAGIIPRTFISRLYGDVLLYDFAGQEAYYSSHAAIIKTLVDACPPVFLLVISLQKDDTDITYAVSYWLGIITNQCASIDGKVPLIIVCSHSDLVMESAEVTRKKDMIIQTIGKYPSTTFELISVVPMDCRYSNSDGMKVLRHFIRTTCNLLRSKLSVNLNSHMFLIYLIETYSSEVALTLKVVQTELEAAIKQQSNKHKKVLPFVPTTISRLVEICIQLSDKGHILFLFNETSPEKSFIIIDKTALLAEINGTIFAPKDFKQHCQLATSTGVVPQTKLTEQCPNFNITMLVQFLSHLELVVPIEDQEVLHLIREHTGYLDTIYLFCPALIRLEVPAKVFVYRVECSYHFGWILSVVQDNQFLDARFLHVLLLRLALSLGLAPVVDPKIPALQHQCSVWRTGVYWNTPQGAEVLVEVTDKKKVVVLLQSNIVSCKLLELRSSVLQKVIEAVRELCPLVIFETFLITPSDMTYPLKFSLPIPMFSLKSVARSTVQRDPFVVSVDAAKRLPVCRYEVYAHLGEQILQTLFNASQNVRIPDDFLSALCSSWSNSPELFGIVHSAIAKEVQSATKESLLEALMTWRDVSNRTYSSLRQILDQLSVFCGQNPLVSFTIIIIIVASQYLPLNK